MENSRSLSPRSVIQQRSFIACLRNIFKSHGEFCASQPWEVVVATLTFLVCLLTIANKQILRNGIANEEIDSTILETIVVTFVRCLAVLHCYYRLKKVHRIGSAFITKIAVIYLLFTSILYALIVCSLCGTAALGDSWFLILLLIDMPKITRMAQFALSSSHQRRVGENLGHGMYVLAPTFVLDTFAKVMLVGMGLLTDFRRLELFAWYASASLLVNFLVYLTFYPAALSLALELMYRTDGRPRWNVRQIINTLPKEEGTNPVVHRVRVLATTVLIMIHCFCKRPLIFSAREKWLDRYVGYINDNYEQVIALTVVLALAVKYLFGEDLDEAVELRKTYVEELTRKLEEDGGDDNSTDEGISLGGGTVEPPCKRGNKLLADDSSSESAWSEVYLPDVKDQEAQTSNNEDSPAPPPSETPEEERTSEECYRILKEGGEMAAFGLSDEEVVSLVESKYIRSHALEKVLDNDHLRGVRVRRKLISRHDGDFAKAIETLPYLNYNYQAVMGACCESVVGYMPVPVGVVGPLKLDDKPIYVPMATTEGCLVASTNRGCSALSKCGGVTSQITDDGMSRGPVLRFPHIIAAKKAKDWLENADNYRTIKSHFDSTSRFARLNCIKIRIAGRLMYLRFVAKTGDAMGMNMLSKATEFTLNKLAQVFTDMQIISISGNMCTDKKPAAINWIEGRGKSVVCEAVIPASVVETTLKTTTAALVDLNIAKNLTGSAMAGSIGGFNAHAANIVTAIYIATGQDAAQNVGSSNCITLMEPWGSDGRDLYITCTMPSIEVGTVGGGTVLDPQSACLEMLGIKGPHPTSPGENARQLARVICGTVLAGELSLMSALAAGHLVRSHLRHNRSSIAVGQITNITQD